MISPLSFMKIKGIFVTHLHGDHTFGLPGLIQTMELSGRKDELVICGPEGIRKALTDILSLTEVELGYELNIREWSGGEATSFEGFKVSSFKTDHIVPSIGYLLEENDHKGRFDRKKAISLGLKPGPDFSKLQNGEKVGDITPDMVIGPSRPGCRVVYSGDTVPCAELSNAAMNADVLIHESTYAHSEAHLASEYKHSTALQVAETAKKCGCRALFLIHISNRYDDLTTLENEARSVFENTFLPNDMDAYKVSTDSIRSA